MADTIQINRAPVLTLWATVVAEQMGYDRDAALTFGKAVAGLTAQAKARTLGIVKPGAEGAKKSGLGEDCWIEICGRAIPAKHTEAGLRAVVKDKPIIPAAAQRYLEQKFGQRLAAVQGAMKNLASTFTAEELAEVAYTLYTKFRPQIPSGVRGWGAKGELDLVFLRSLAKGTPPARRSRPAKSNRRS